MSNPIDLPLVRNPDTLAPDRETDPDLTFVASSYLFRSLDTPTKGWIVPQQQIPLSGTAAQRQQENPALFQALTDAGLTPAAIADLSQAGWEALTQVDPAVVNALLQAGMSPQDTAALASTINPPEINKNHFTDVLRQKLDEKLPAAEALLWARFSGVAQESELADPAFFKDLAEASKHGWGHTKTRALRYARAQQLASRLQIDPARLLALTPGELDNVLSAGPNTVRSLLGRNLTLQQIGQASEADRITLLGGDAGQAALVIALLGAGMSPHDVAQYAGTVISPKEATPEFIDKVRERLGKGASAEAAIAWARYGDQLTEAELADPKFLHDLLFAAQEWKPATQGQEAERMIAGLSYARDHVDIFEAAEQLAVPGSDASNKWFANAGVFQLADMKSDDPKWLLIERTIGRKLTLAERQEAIDAAKGLKDNWSTLCSQAGTLGLKVRDGTTDVLDFTQDDLSKLNLAPLISQLGTAPATLDSVGMALLTSLDHLRNHVDLFEAAEKVMVPGGNADNGWFANAGVYQLAGMEEDSPEWAKIEETLGHAVSPEERRAAIKAAKNLTDNWGQLCEMAGQIGLKVRSGTTDVIDFKTDELKKLNFSPLTGLIDAEAGDRADILKYARAQQLARHLAAGDATPGTDLDAILNSNLSPEQTTKLLAMDPAVIKALLKQDWTLPQIADRPRSS